MSAPNLAHPTLPTSPTSTAVLSEREIPALLQKLQSLLPYSLPLYRRLQFHLLHPNPPSAHAFLSLASPTSPHTWLLSPDTSTTAPWLAAHIDLSHAGQTQIWVFASWEVPRDGVDPGAAPSTETQTSLLTSLLATLSTHPDFIPALPISAPESHRLLDRTGKYTTPYSRHKVLFGALHEALAALIPAPSIARIDGDYLKYLFPPTTTTTTTSAHAAANEALPPGYRFGPMKDEYLQIVLDRTAIPRTLATLKLLGSIGLFYDDPNDTRSMGDANAQQKDERRDEEPDQQKDQDQDQDLKGLLNRVNERLAGMQTAPIGWGFLGKDASLSSLHTEQQHRGKNLAAAVSRKLFAMQGGCFDARGTEGRQRCQVHKGEEQGEEPGGEEEDEREGGWSEWAHADVSANNVGSRRVMEKLGGQVRWKVAWVEVDLEKLGLGLGEGL